MEQLLTPSQVAQRCGVAVVTLRRWRRQTRETGQQVGPRFISLSSKLSRYRPADVEAWLHNAKE